MTIYINDEQIDFTLEGGEKAWDIYESIRGFLSQSQMLVYSFLIDGKETDPEDKSWAGLDTEKIKKIEVTALTEDEFRLTGLLTVAEYINFLTRSVAEGKLDEIGSVIDDYPSIIRNISILVKGEQGQLLSDHLEAVMKRSGLLDGQFNESYKSDFLKEVEGISEIINSASREISDPLSELDKSIKALDLLKPKLADVSLLLQTGKDREAMNIIISLTEFLQKIIRLLSLFDTDNIDMERFNSVLSELVEAFDAGDSVLIGDLLEYEISPLLEQMADAYAEIRKREEN